MTEIPSAEAPTPAPAAEVEPATANDAAAQVRAKNQRLATLAVGVFLFVLISTFAITIFIHYAGLHHSVLAPQ